MTEHIKRAVAALGNRAVSLSAEPAVERAPAVPVEERPRSANLRVRREFSDQERNRFLKESLTFIRNYFENSLHELSIRNNQASFDFEALEDGFRARVYRNGHEESTCQIWAQPLGSSSGMTGIFYSSEFQRRGSGLSFNERLSVEDDGYSLALKSMGIAGGFQDSRSSLSQEGAAELLWGIVVRPLQ